MLPMKNIQLAVEDHQWLAIADAAHAAGYVRPNGGGDVPDFLRAILGGFLQIVPPEGHIPLSVPAIPGIEPINRRNRRKGDAK